MTTVTLSFLVMSLFVHDERERLLFAFRGGLGDVLAFGETGEELLGYEPPLRGWALRNEFGDLSLRRGTWALNSQGKVWRHHLEERNEGTIEILVRLPSDPGTIPVPFLRWGSLRLAQKGAELFLLGESWQRNLGGVEQPTRPVHFVLTWKGDRWQSFVNVRRRVKGDMSLLAELPRDNADPLLGSGDPQRPGWSGHLLGLAVYGNSVDEEIVRRLESQWRERLAGRRDLPRSTVRARLKARSRVPTLEDISPYREALVVFEYEPIEWIDGMSFAERIRVVHWAILDEQIVPYAASPIGRELTLKLTPMALNRQLGEVFLEETLPFDPDIELYYDAGGSSLELR